MSLDVRLDGGIATLILDRPDDGNSVDDATLETLAETLGTLALDPAVRALIVTGAGTDFCRGRIPTRSGGAPATALAVRERLSRIVAVNRALRYFPHPTVAAVEGRALGFGCGLAVQCDISIAGEQSRLGFPELVGDLPPLIVLSYLGRIIPRKLALDLILTGRSISGAEALQMGLISQVVPSGSSAGRARETAASLLGRNPLAVSLVRRFAREALTADEDTAAQYGITMLGAFLASRPS